VVVQLTPKADGILKPGIYCFHGNCQDEVGAASYRLRSALGKQCPSVSRAPLICGTRLRPARPEFNPEKLTAIAARLDGVDEDWFSRRSPLRVDVRTPASFLHHLYHPGENVLVFDAYKSQGQAIWTHRPPPFDGREIDRFRFRRSRGVWFLANPVTGFYQPNDSGKSSRRSWQNVTAWRYLVLESDTAAPSEWLSVLAQMPLPISAITTSGGKSIHALVRLDAGSKSEWNAAVGELKPILVTLGADPKSLSAVRLTRLPLCERLGSDGPEGYVQYSEPQPQKLLYLNPRPTPTPLCEKEVL
jgi:hypothetical protein